ncbi:MAG: hypothetical protein NC416_16225 [Eubacterium sp.]|nr:hypothetical protein [Eubacterium sp.]
MDKKREKFARDLEKEALKMKSATVETVQRYGNAVKQHYAAYFGMEI